MEWYIMARESQTATGTIRREKLTHGPCKNPEHAPHGKPQEGANPGKKHANPTAGPARAIEQERSQGPARQTPTRQQTKSCPQHGPPPAPPPSPEHYATAPVTQGQRMLCTDQQTQEPNWHVIQPSKHQSRLRSRQDGTNQRPRRSGRTQPTISYKGM